MVELGIRRAILAIAVTTICALPAAVAAAGADVVYTVGNYPVEASDTDAVAAKSKAMSEGQQNAFRSLLKRIVPVTQYHRLKSLRAAAKAGDLIDGVAVRSERNSSTRYIASLDFTFRANDVRELLRRENVPFVDTQAPALVVVLLQKGADGLKSADAGPWQAAWQGLDRSHTLTPYKLEPLKPQTKPETLAAVIAGDPRAFEELSRPFGTDLVLLAIIEPDAKPGRLLVTLAGQDAVGPFTLQRPYRVEADDQAYTHELAAVVSLGILEGRWKAYKAASTRGGYAALGAPPLPVQISVEYDGLAEWQGIRRTIADLPGVEDLQIGGVSARGADIALRFPGGGEQLAAAVRRQGLELQGRGGAWTLRALR